MSEVDIKQLIKNYIKVDDDIATINKDVKELRKTKTGYEENIKQYMIDNNIAKVDIGTGTLRISKTKVAKKHNKRSILTVLLESLDDNKANEIIEELFNDDDGDEVTKLERSKKN